jgi:hypothetical protein
MAIARINYVISHDLDALLNVIDPTRQNGRNADKIGKLFRICFCSALIDEPSTITMSPG